MNRRNFIGHTALAAGGLMSALTAPGLLAGQAKRKPRIRIVYALHAEKQPRPDWPNQGFDFKPHMERITNELTRKCRNLEFCTALAEGPEKAKAILDQDKAAGTVDGYVVYQMNCWNRVVQTLAESGKPVLYADFQFGGSGGFLVYNAAFLRQKQSNVGYVASSRMKDLVEAVRCFETACSGGNVNFADLTTAVRVKSTRRPSQLLVKHDPVECLEPAECIKKLNAAKILAIRDQQSGAGGEMAGIPIQRVSFAELNEAWKSADPEQAKAVADGWQKTARTIEGVNRETLENSAAMYLAEKALLKKHEATGITVNCLGGFYGGHIHAYPCLGFHQLLNEGLIGGCECDVESAATMVLGTILTKGRPGYISDPVIDTAKRQIIYAHCVASNRALGPAGPANPFDIMTHSEDRQGASVRSLLPTRMMTTTLKLDAGRKEILFHQGVAVENDPDDRACRTKICAEPAGDIEKLFTMWDQWKWHRVTFYGDLKQPVYALGEALGYKVLEEA
jgi:hypothetical protein